MNPGFKRWFQHPRVWLLIGLICTPIFLGMCINAYEPPTKIPDVTDLNVSVQAGTSLTFSIPVDRHLDRHCSVDATRYISGPTYGARKLEETSHISAETIQRRNTKHPNELNLTIFIPTSTLAGPTTITTENRYRCWLSPISWFVPIDDAWEINFTTLPARQGVVIVNP